MATPDPLTACVGILLGCIMIRLMGARIQGRAHYARESQPDAGEAVPSTPASSAASIPAPAVSL